MDTKLRTSKTVTHRLVHSYKSLEKKLYYYHKKRLTNPLTSPPIVTLDDLYETDPRNNVQPLYKPHNVTINTGGKISGVRNKSDRKRNPRWPRR